MFENHSIIEKTALGRSELQNRLSNILPRELRTVLILIDGKKCVEDYIKVLKGRDFLVEYSSVTDCFQALLDLEMIAIVNHRGLGAKKSKKSALRKESAKPSETDAWEEAFSVTPNSVVPDEAPVALHHREPSDTEANPVTPQLVSELVGIIEADIPGEAWEYVFELESATSSEAVLTLIENLYKAHRASFSAHNLQVIKSIAQTLKRTL